MFGALGGLLGWGVPLGYLAASAMWMFSIEVKGGVACGGGGLVGCAAQFFEEGVDVKVGALRFESCQTPLSCSLLARLRIPLLLLLY